MSSYTSRFSGAELAPLLASIIARGVSDGELVTEDPQLAAWFILGSFSAAEAASLTAPDQLDGVLDALTAFVLRGLGWRGERGGGGTDPGA